MNFFGELLKRLPQQQDQSQILKMITIIHRFVIRRNYESGILNLLEEIDPHCFSKNTSEKWFEELTYGYLSYLKKLSFH